MKPAGIVALEIIGAHVEGQAERIPEIIRADRAAVLRWAADQLDRFADDRNAAEELRKAAADIERGETR